MAPDQVLVTSVSAASDTYAIHIQHLLSTASIRATLDDRSERLPRKIIDAREHCIPISLTMGKRDQDHQTISLRLRDGSQKIMDWVEAIEQIKALMMDINWEHRWNSMMRATRRCVPNSQEYSNSAGQLLGSPR
jgi:threonyl-tRNA synthetase